MTACILFWAGLGWWAATMLVQWISAGLGRWRRPADPVRHGAADFSIVAPMVGRRDASPAYVRSLAELARAGAEVLICVTAEDDEAVGYTRADWPDAPILVGSDDTFNPKLNNVRKGLEAASRPIVALCDAGIDLELSELTSAAAHLSDKVGLVLALKTGNRPENFAAEMECSYINGHQARFLMAADRLGMPVASGGVTILARDTLQSIGGHQGFLNYLADDYSVVRMVRDRLGQTTWLARVMPRLLVGGRRWQDVWRRQVRWGSTRLKLSPEVRALVLLEPAIGWLASGLALFVALLAVGVAPTWLALALIAHTVAWLAAEAWFLAAHGLPFGPRAWAAALAREALVPLLAVQAWLGRNRIDWRGTNLAAGWQPSRDGTAGKHV
ncbi:glycosyltransferase family 2 protein [Reyranella soli]|jgi:ceramide glucosyltransferase|uniref:Ceramide glucosyltransferase n=1 Tax=Reyranella soli TaxID=1230389 RepID=A0A512NBH6_9HYPH|nr:glycosyltransferase [Reyranella soli]GEP56298.1 ceramide glucosyltransferase [Reyranella soli]